MQKGKLMVNIIKSLFESYEYVCQEVGQGNLFSKIEATNKKDFWYVVVEENLDTLLNNQDEILKLCSDMNDSDELVKNISMLILWNTGGRLDYKVMKKKIMPIEEDPYYFKKHVLYFSLDEYTRLIEEVSNRNITDFIKETIPKSEVFKEYKLNPHSQNWHELLYRMAMKLPFISINIDTSAGIESLEENINRRLTAHTSNRLKNLNDKVFELYEEISIEELKIIDTTELINNLIPSIEEQDNGN